MIIVYVIITVWLLAWLLPKLLRWLLKRGAQKMQRRMFEQMGIDPSVFEQAMNAEQRQAASASGFAGRGFGGRQRRKSSRRRFTGRIIPPDYAETVSFVELTLTGTEVWLDPTGSPVFTEYRSETQISDAKWTLIK